MIIIIVGAVFAVALLSRAMTYTVRFTEAAVLMDEDSAFIPTAYRKIVWAMRKNVRTPIMPNDQLDLRFVNLD